jgi:cell division protein FtsW (lipid II flippase)
MVVTLPMDIMMGMIGFAIVAFVVIPFSSLTVRGRLKKWMYKERYAYYNGILEESGLPPFRYLGVFKDYKTPARLLFACFVLCAAYSAVMLYNGETGTVVAYAAAAAPFSLVSFVGWMWYAAWADSKVYGVWHSHLESIGVVVPDSSATSRGYRHDWSVLPEGERPPA